MNIMFAMVLIMVVNFHAVHLIRSEIVDERKIEANSEQCILREAKQKRTLFDFDWNVNLFRYFRLCALRSF